MPMGPDIDHINLEYYWSLASCYRPHSWQHHKRINIIKCIPVYKKHGKTNYELEILPVTVLY